MPYCINGSTPGWGYKFALFFGMCLNQGMNLAQAAFKRAPLSLDFEALRGWLPELLSVLEAQPDWYGSIYVEKKSSRNLMAKLNQTQVSNDVTLGAVLRIYDGYTLFEQASDDLDPESLKRTARELAERVSKTQAPAGAVKRPYRPATWKERLAAPLEREITTQVPKDVAATTPVHFGVQFRRDPLNLNTGDRIQHLKDLVQRCVSLAHKAGLESNELSYVMARDLFIEEQALFIDRETNMSQTLYRVALLVITMSGADRTYNRIGGLGGLEAVEMTDDDLLSLLKDLKSLKNAERLAPGKYRVLFGPVLAGVLAHEAFGHSQEGDTCARGRSKAWELYRSGELVGNQHATILNNPAIFQNGPNTYAAWGSYFFDEEGWLAQEQLLLNQGKLEAPMTNLTSAIRLGVPRTANGKRENWSHGVYTRQTNTYFSAGTKTLDQLMAQIQDGFIAHHAAGGMEDPKGMGIQVGIAYLEEVKNGKTTGRVFKGPAGGDIQLTGYTPDVLNSIVDKSKIEFNTATPDKAKHPFNDVGGCGKYHKEIVQAGCGGPYLLLDQVILG